MADNRHLLVERAHHGNLMPMIKTTRTALGPLQTPRRAQCGTRGGHPRAGDEDEDPEEHRGTEAPRRSCPGTATAAAELIGLHPNSRHCFVPSWMGPGRHRDKGFIVCWIHQHENTLHGRAQHGAAGTRVPQGFGHPCALPAFPLEPPHHGSSQPGTTLLCRAQMIPGSCAHVGTAHGAERSSTCCWGQPGPPKPNSSPLVMVLLVLSELEGGRSSYRWTNTLLARGKGGTGQGPRVTHHFEVFRGALLPTEEAGQQHLPDVMASPVIKLQHVERFGFEVSEVGLVLQDFQLLLIGCLDVWDLVSWGERAGRGSGLAVVAAPSGKGHLGFPGAFPAWAQLSPTSHVAFPEHPTAQSGPETHERWQKDG